MSNVMTEAVLSAICETNNVVEFLNDLVTSVFQREFKFRRKTSTSADANGVPFIFKSIDLNWLDRAYERIPVNYACLVALTQNSTNQHGDAQLFTPIVAPFHVDEDGNPVTQIRIYAYTPKSDGESFPRGTIMARLEPYGTETKFDRDSKYANQSALSEPISA